MQKSWRDRPGALGRRPGRSQSRASELQAPAGARPEPQIHPRAWPALRGRALWPPPIPRARPASSQLRRVPAQTLWKPMLPPPPDCLPVEHTAPPPRSRAAAFLLSCCSPSELLLNSFPQEEFDETRWL